MPKTSTSATPRSAAPPSLLLAMGIIVLLGALAYFILTLAGQPPHPRQPRHPLHRAKTAFPSTMTVRHLAGLRDDRGRHPWPCAGAGLRARAAPTPTIRSCCSSGAQTTPTRTSSSQSEKRPQAGLWRHQPPQGEPERGRCRRHRRALRHSGLLRRAGHHRPTTAATSVYVSGLTKLASISDIVNLVESVSLS